MRDAKIGSPAATASDITLAPPSLREESTMGGEPQSALAIATVPFGLEAKIEADLTAMLAGANEVLREAHCALVGGHTSEGAELSLGFAVNGLVSRTAALRKGGLRPGDALILTKPLGTGTILAADMTTGTHGSTFGGNPLAMAVAGAVLDVMLADGFLDRVQRISLVLKQKLAEIRDRHPAVIAEVRGEGLLVGLRCVVPNGELVNALHREKMVTVAAGDNVVRLLPPLIVSDQEIAEGMRRLDRACTSVASALGERRQGAAG